MRSKTKFDWRVCVFAALCGVLALNGALAQNPEKSPEPAVARPAAAEADFAAFELILQRNVFDPDRRKPRPAAQPGEVREERTAEPEVRTRHIYVVGSFIQGEQAYAVLAGENVNVPRDVKTGDQAGEFTIGAIDENAVVFKKDGQELRVPVGAEINSRGDAAWQVALESRRTGINSGGNSREGRRGDGDRSRNSSRRGDGDVNSTNDGSSATAGGSGASESAGGGGVSDILKRLKEQRAKETGQ